MNQLEYLQLTIAGYPDKQVTFENAVVVKSSPHITVFTCWAACIGPEGICLMDEYGCWHGPLKQEQAFANLVIGSLYQRLKALNVKPSVVIASYDQDVNAVIFE